MAKKLNAMPDYQARMPKQPHDVSQSTALTACPGMILPVYYDALHLGDEIHFNASMFARLNPLSIASLGDIDLHMDYFFVPLTVMYTPASSLFYQTDDLVSSLFADNRRSTSFSSKFPVFNFTRYLTALTSQPEFSTAPSVLISASENSGTAIKYPAESFDVMRSSLYRMFDLLDLDPDALLITSGSGAATLGLPNFTPWFALAYQACYQLYYRNDDRELKNYHYNIDSWADAGMDPVVGTANIFDEKSIFALNYVNRPKDYFNSVKVSPIGSSVSMLSSVSSYSLFNSVNEWLNLGKFGLINAGFDASFGGNMKDAVSVGGLINRSPLPPSSIISASAYSSASIRQLFMVDKLLRVIGRADKNYESQFLAHYGVKIPHDVMHNITHIGHDMITFSPEAILSTANTWNGSTGSALGEVGGQGQTFLKGKKRNFKAPFHGVFLCLTYFQPRMRYLGGFNKLHQLNSPLDFWQPEYDRKGMQPIFSYEAELPDAEFTTGRLGWQFAYEQFKRKYDRITRAFTPVLEGQAGANPSVNTYSPWVISSRPYSFLKSDGTLAESPVSLNGGSPTIQVYNLMSSPCDLNGIMQVPHNTAWSTLFETAPWLIYQTDPLICDFNMHIKKVNYMSEYGEPEL